jgi:hypothetical protein
VRDVLKACRELGSSSRWWPELNPLLEAVGEARKTRLITAQSSLAGPTSDLTQAANDAVGLLPTSMLRELDALEPAMRQGIVVRLAESYIGADKSDLGALRAKAAVFVRRQLDRLLPEEAA